MSEEEGTQVTAEVELEESPQADWFLRTLVKVVNGTGSAFGITLTIGGTLISGQLVSGRAYFEKFADDFSGALRDFYKSAGIEGEAADTVEEHFLRIAESYPDPFAEDPEDREGELTDTAFLHLTEARIYNPGGPPIPNPTGEGFWWRGRISSVDGFSLGKLGVNE